VEALTDVRQLLDAGMLPLRISEQLRPRHHPDDIAAALTQWDLRTRAAVKFSRAEHMLFTRPGLEQSSAEVVARHRARRFSGCHHIADLCCGIGGDLLALGALAEHVTAVDIDPTHLAMAHHNSKVYGVGANVSTICADVRHISLDGVDATFADPARRTAAGRFRPGDMEPDLTWCLALAGGASRSAQRVAIKLPPGVDVHAIPQSWQLEFVAMGRDLKEAVAWSPYWPGNVEQGNRLATVIGATGVAVTVIDDGLGDCDIAGVSGYLLDPSPAVTRAGLVSTLARVVGGHRIDERIGFIASDAMTTTEFGRWWRVEVSMPGKWASCARGYAPLMWARWICDGGDSPETWRAFGARCG
jgi:hypothetical protein